MNLDNSNRARAKLLIFAFPGIHLRKLQKLLNVSFTTTRYHVENLERDSEIVCSKDGRYHRLYPAGTNDRMKEVYSVLQGKNNGRVLRALANDDEHALTNGDLSEMLHLPRSTISECANALARVDLAERSLTLDGRILYRIGDLELVEAARGLLERNPLNTARDNFLDLWDI